MNRLRIKLKRNNTSLKHKSINHKNIKLKGNNTIKRFNKGSTKFNLQKTKFNEFRIPDIQQKYNISNNYLKYNFSTVVRNGITINIKKIDTHQPPEQLDAERVYVSQTVNIDNNDSVDNKADDVGIENSSINIDKDVSTPLERDILREEKKGDHVIKERELSINEKIDKVELDGPKGPEPTRYGDWSNKGRCYDF